MECGPTEYWCHFLTWFSENSELLKQLPSLSDWWAAAFGSKGWVLAFIKEHGEKIIAAASLAFAIWRWWVYRERILHKRLEEYIRESDTRLKPTSEQVVEALLRPGRTVALPQPTFAVELGDILDTNGWRYWFGLSSLNAQANWQLGRRLAGIRNRMRTARDAINSLQAEQAQLHMIAGAVAAGRARRTKDRTEAEKFDKLALREFQKALQIPGHQQDFGAKENEAFQLLRLGRLDLAADAYKELEKLADQIGERRKRELIVARARRYRAVIREAQSHGQPLGAWNLIRPRTGDADGPGALFLMNPHRPFDRWEAIEFAEALYIAAFIASRNQFPLEEREHRDQAEAVYTGVLSEFRWTSLLRRENRQLRTEARAGLERVVRAQKMPGEYKIEWLRPN